jgi:hypothetical protein
MKVATVYKNTSRVFFNVQLNNFVSMQHFLIAALKHKITESIRCPAATSSGAGVI